MNKTACFNYNHGKDRCNLLVDLVCEKKCRCSFFCTHEQRKASILNHARILQNKSYHIQEKVSHLYYGGKMPWNDI